MKDTLLLVDERFLDHEPPFSHPERPERLRRIYDVLAADPPPRTARATARPATSEELGRVHGPGYVESILALRGRSTQLDSDTWLSPGSVDAALLAAGAAVEATRAVVAGEAKNAFALVRPPGHHAESGRAMGFCVFNNVAVAAAAARAALGVDRVLVVDFDVHHGNGTQEIFWRRNDVLYFSTHRAPPFYPQTGALEEIGEDAGRGHTVNVPLPRGMGDADFLAAHQELLERIAEDFRPGLLLVSAGFDGHEDDPLGGMRMRREGYRALAALLRAIAERHADGRIVFVLEGGYDLDGLAGGVRAVLETLVDGAAAPPPRATPSPEAARVIASARALHAAHWPALR